MFLDKFQKKCVTYDPRPKSRADIFTTPMCGGLYKKRKVSPNAFSVYNRSTMN